MYKTIKTRHVQAYGKSFTFFVSLAGEKFRGGLYPGHITAAYEAEIFKWYMRNKYGIKWHTMKAYVSDTDLQAYADERGFKLTLDGVFQWLSPCIKDKLTHEGSQIAAAFAELELPLKHKELLREAVREERHGLKNARLAYKSKLNQENAAVWRVAQSDVSLAWRNAKLDVEAVREFLRDAIFSGELGPSRQLQAEDLLHRIEAKKTPLGGVPITREQALEGLGDPATWDAESKALYAEFEKKPNAT